MAIPAHSLEHTLALAQFARVFDALFGSGQPAWANAPVKLEDVCEKIPLLANPAYFSEPFWGSDDKGVVAVFCALANGRPVLMAVVPFNGPRPTDPGNEVAAKVVALRSAKARSRDL